MLIQSPLQMRGRVTVEYFDVRTGRLVRRVEHNNLITSAGKAVAASAMSNNSNGISHIAVGDGTTAPTIGDTALSNEQFRGAVLSTSRDGAGGLTLTLTLGTGDNNGNTIAESGLFDASSGGNLIARVVYDSVDRVDKTATITAQISWTITFGA